MAISISNSVRDLVDVKVDINFTKPMWTKRRINNLIKLVKGKCYKQTYNGVASIAWMLALRYNAPTYSWHRLNNVRATPELIEAYKSAIGFAKLAVQPNDIWQVRGLDSCLAELNKGVIPTNTGYIGKYDAPIVSYMATLPLPPALETLLEDIKTGKVTTISYIQ